MKVTIRFPSGTNASSFCEIVEYRSPNLAAALECIADEVEVDMDRVNLSDATDIMYQADEFGGYEIFT